MTKFFKMVVCVSAVGGLAGPALAQNSATSTTSATTTIIQPISIANNSLLAFGRIVKPSTAVTSNIAIDASTGARTVGAGAIAAPGASSRATYTATGEGAQTFSISAPSFSMTSGANTLAVTTSTSAATGTLSGTLGSTGTATFGVGGAFNVTDTTPSGLYTGNLAVTVAYN